MDEKVINIIDSATDVAAFSKTHQWPKEESPEFFEFAQKLDNLATAINAKYPNFNKNILTSKIISATPHHA